ncbi:MAG: HEAT repeat domain-containing protein [Deltaproteobacteria bacterium]|nr:HEAT repeat domain-containing protein [Deltaproteobacteria bacterium]
MKGLRRFVTIWHVALVLLACSVVAMAQYEPAEDQWQGGDAQANWGENQYGQKWGGNYGGDSWQELEKQRKEILRRLPDEPDLLINLTDELMPATPDLTALGRKGTRALVRGLLDNASDGIRQTCASVLAQVRDPEAASALIDALADRNEMVRMQALIGLGNLAEPGFGPHFVKRIEDPEETYVVKNAAVTAIGDVGYSKAMPLLMKLVKADDQTYAWTALAAMWDMRNKAGRGDLVDAFLYVLKKETGSGSQVVEYLGELKAEEASDLLAKFFVGRDVHTKNRVILALGKIGSSGARKMLKDVMKTTQTARHLNNAAIALAKLGDRKEVIGILVGLLQDRKAYMRINAAFALGEIEASEPAAVEGLVTALSDPNDFVRSEAAVALGRIKAASAAPRLEELANGTNPFVALDAVIALNRIDFGKYRQLIFDKLLVHKEPKFARIVSRGIRFLAEQKDPAALPYLLAFLRQPSGNYGDTLQLLAPYAADQLSDFQTSIQYLVHTCSYDCFGTLMRNLRDWKLGAVAPALLERLYRMYYLYDKETAYFTIGKVGSKELTARIAGIQETSNALKLYQQFALANLGDEAALQKLVDVVRDGNLEDKRDAAFLLGSIDVEAVVPKLAELMEKGDAFTSLTATAALVGLAHAPAFDRLYKVMKDGTPSLAAEATRVFMISPSKKVDEYLAKAAGRESDLVTKRRCEEILYQRQPKEFR